MAKFSRRKFIGSSTALAAGLGLPTQSVLAAAAPISSQVAPDYVVINAKVFTIDEDQPQAEAFAVKGDRFTAVGSSSDIRNLASSGTETIDAEGMTVVPGFIDAHSHPSSAGVNELVQVNADLRSITEIKEVLRQRAAITQEGQWVRAFKYDDTKLAEGRPINRFDIDEVVPNHPAVVGHRGGHTGVYNSMALALAGVTSETPDPPGGRFYRDSNGVLTGLAAERARYVFNSLIPSDSTREQRRDGVKLITELMTKAGLTSVHQTGASRNDMIAYQDARADGGMRFRMYLFPRVQLFEDLVNAGIRSGFGDEVLRIGAVKFSADGSASERTMRMSTPFEGRPDDYGILTMSQEEIHEAVENAHRNDFQIGIHANGDVTIEMVLNAYERVQRLWPRNDPRHRIEHCSLVNPALLQRIKDLGVIPAPFYTYVHYHGNKWVEYGEEKMRWMFAHKSFLDYNIPVAPASDYTPGPFEPMMALQSMVTRKDFDGRVWGPNQRITIDQAMRICTLNGAYASFEENIKGSITAGKLADFVILADDPHDVDPDNIKNIEIVRTVVGGTTMYAV
ncbi:MAG: amidohydrolase [Gammaproteobacteria bacterium]|nr:amidohydrolase [Gammaproteobacteria bacterium]MEC9222272.1 amidohydrolase [Pseudomonadota bacterium]MEE2608925.1 amidohydrolase [Pseudomonadota bacterium]MEE3171839.1 amidohydrolase [Pseudomonadota bacterium]